MDELQEVWFESSGCCQVSVKIWLRFATSGSQTHNLDTWVNGFGFVGKIETGNHRFSHEVRSFLVSMFPSTNSLIGFSGLLRSSLEAWSLHCPESYNHAVFCISCGEATESSLTPQLPTKLPEVFGIIQGTSPAAVVALREAGKVWPKKAMVWWFDAGLMRFFSDSGTGGTPFFKLGSEQNPILLWCWIAVEISTCFWNHWPLLDAVARRPGTFADDPLVW